MCSGRAEQSALFTAVDLQSRGRGRIMEGISICYYYLCSSRFGGRKGEAVSRCAGAHGPRQRLVPWRSQPAKPVKRPCSLMRRAAAAWDHVVHIHREHFSCILRLGAILFKTRSKWLRKKSENFSLISHDAIKYAVKIQLKM